MLPVAGISFFVGKGGVGKTTVAAAHAVWWARRHPRQPVLLLSTDPAHSLADVFGTPFGNRPRRLSAARGQLFVWQVDAQRQFRRFLGRYRDAILEVVAAGTIFSRDEIAPLLDTTLPGMAEISALLALEQLLSSGRYAHLVVDTAPIGHTLRLFELPEHFARLLDFLDTAASRDRVLAQHFGGRVSLSRPFLEEWRGMVRRVQQALAGDDARLVLVTTPESFALNESVRVAAQLREAVPDLSITDIVLNRVVSHPGMCAVCRDRARATKSAVSFLRRKFPAARHLSGGDPGGPILGAASLASFGAHVFDRRVLRVAAKPPRRGREVALRPAAWPRLDTPLSFTLGKGGVGKTTISAALAFAERAQGPSVLVASTDPAPSLDDVFERAVGDQAVPVLGDPAFRAMEIDSVAEFRRWSEEMKRMVGEALRTDVRGVHVDLAFDREVLLRLLDIVPPGVDELFAVLRIVDLLETSAAARVVIDMAPTGHALELLRMPERMLLWSRLLLKSLAAHRTLPLARDVAVEVARVAQRVRALAQMIADPRRATSWPVMLAEPLPDRETARLLGDLAQLRVPVQAVFVNRVLFAAEAGRCPRCLRQRAWQMATLAEFRRRRRGEILVARNVPGGIAGARKLKAFTSELWRIEAQPRSSRKR